MEEPSWHLQSVSASSWGNQTKGDVVFLLHTYAMSAWLCAWLWSLELEMEEDTVGVKSQPGRKQLERDHFPPWHREGAGDGRVAERKRRGTICFQVPSLFQGYME